MPDLGVGAGASSGQADGGVGSLGLFPELSLEQFMDEKGGDRLPTVFDTPGAPVKVDGIRQKIVDEALSYEGTPYVWGGTSRKGVDCSGLVQQAFAPYGVDLPRISYQQANSGRHIEQAAAQPGDLVAWDNSERNDGADHIAVYLGDGWILEAPRPGLNVRRRKLDASESAFFVDMGGLI